MTAGSRLWWRYLQSEWKTIHSTLLFPYTPRIIITSVAFCQPLCQCTASKALSLKLRKRIPSSAQTRIITVQFDSLTDMLIDWLFPETIDNYESPIDNIIFNDSLFQVSNHSSKSSDRDMHANRTYGNSPSN